MLQSKVSIILSVIFFISSLFSEGGMQGFKTSSTRLKGD